MEAHWKKAWQEAAVIVETHGHGTLSADMRRHLEGITDPLLDWRSLLWRHLVRTPVDFTGFDRRFIGSGLYLEALEGETVAARIALDTSGSVGSAELAQFLAEVREILRLYPQIDAQLFYADAALYGPFDACDESLSSPIGGGGTSFVPFFDRMQEEVDAAQMVVLIYLTDGYGTFPRQPPEHPVLWVVTPGGLPSNKFPFGSVARLIAPTSS
jgi:predicted metal-dependent peptidase